MTKEGLFSLLLLFAPKVGEEGVLGWSMLLELTSESYRPLFDALQTIEGILLVILSAEDTIGVDGTLVDAASFPWSAERLIMAAVRDEENGELVVRAGRSYIPSRP